jgi:hypothetical protein
MNQSYPDTHRLPYYWEYLKRFGKESFEKLWKDFSISFALATLQVLFKWSDQTVWESAVLGAKTVALVFGVLALWHLFHTSFILFSERAHPEYGGLQYTNSWHGAWGAAVFLAMIVSVGYAALPDWLRDSQPIVLRVPTPAVIPTAPMPSPPQNDGGRDAKPSKQSSRAATRPVPNASQAPSQATSPPIQTQQPVTFLDRIVQENRGLTPDDRNRLSNELYECDQFIKQSQDVGYKLNSEFGKLNNDRQSGALSKNVDEHIKILRDLSTSAMDRYHGLQHFQQKWQYFPNQTEYVFGGNPFNEGVGLLGNATEGMATSLTRWSKIPQPSRDQQDILNIEAQQQVDCEKYLRQFFDWASLTLQRVKQMRQSLDPNGVVQPLPTNAVAPAVGMFSLKGGEAPTAIRCF